MITFKCIWFTFVILTPDIGVNYYPKAETYNNNVLSQGSDTVYAAFVLA